MKLITYASVLKAVVILYADPEKQNVVTNNLTVASSPSKGMKLQMKKVNASSDSPRWALYDIENKKFLEVNESNGKVLMTSVQNRDEDIRSTSKVQFSSKDLPAFAFDVKEVDYNTGALKIILNSGKCLTNNKQIGVGKCRGSKTLFYIDRLEEGENIIKPVRPPSNTSKESSTISSTTVNKNTNTQPSTSKTGSEPSTNQNSEKPSSKDVHKEIMLVVLKNDEKPHVFEIQEGENGVGKVIEAIDNQHDTLKIKPSRHSVQDEVDKILDDLKQGSDSENEDEDEPVRKRRIKLDRDSEMVSRTSPNHIQQPTQPFNYPIQPSAPQMGYQTPPAGSSTNYPIQPSAPPMSYSVQQAPIGYPAQQDPGYQQNDASKPFDPWASQYSTQSDTQPITSQYTQQSNTTPQLYPALDSGTQYQESRAMGYQPPFQPAYYPYSATQSPIPQSANPGTENPFSVLIDGLISKAKKEFHKRHIAR